MKGRGPCKDAAHRTELFYIKSHQLESPKLGCCYITGKVGVSFLLHSHSYFLTVAHTVSLIAPLNNKGRFNRVKPNLAQLLGVLPRASEQLVI